MGTTVQEIEEYIWNAFADQNFLKCEIFITDYSDGYASYNTFATVCAITLEGVEKTIEVVVKSSREDLIQSSPSLYGREAYFYGTILPAFTNFQKQNKVKEIFCSVPRCYQVTYNSTMEVIVMENLRRNGYDLCDRKKPLDLNHLKLTLGEYGKFHAISFAFRHKRKDDFQNLVTNFEDVMINYFDDSLIRNIQQNMIRACDIVKEVNEKKLYETCHKVLQKGADIALIEIMKTVEPDSAILHGNDWSNNFLYEYEDPGIPSKVAILNWQFARLHSPVLDLSYLIYSTCSEEELKHFDVLLETYYKSFSNSLKDLGCDSESIFPYSTLRIHWKKYSLFGVLMLITYLHLIICEDKELPDFDECKSQTDFTEKLMNIKVTNESEYRKRIIAAVAHYCNYNDS